MRTQLKKNKSLFILPLLLLPFIFLIFYILGGGTGKKDKEVKSANTQGANYVLPEAEKNIEIFDKMEAYEKEVGQTSTKDYNVTGERDSAYIPGYEKAKQSDSTAFVYNPGPGITGEDVSGSLLAHIKQKERAIKRELDGHEQESNSDERKKGNEYSGSTGKGKSRTTGNAVYTPKHTNQQAEASIQATGIRELDKVFDENISLNQQNDSLIFILQQAQNQLAIIEKQQNTGFSLDRKQVSVFEKKERAGALIKAEIYETTTVLDGNRVKLRLLEDTWVNKNKVPKNSLIYGVCKIKNERLHIEITQLPVHDNFLPVNLVIHDLDGMPGLYVPDNAARKVSREVGAGTNTSSLFGVTNDPLTYAGIRAADRTAQTLLKRVRLKRVTLKKNTLVYIINKK